MPIVMVLLTAGVVRFYRLGVPSMWWDEVLTAIMSTFPADYIVQWTRQCEVHPPLFYFLVKGLAWFGTSDAALRFPWTATSLLQLFSAYVLCKRWISARAGLLVAALLAANPLHALLSRQLRPYPLILLLQTLSLLLLREWIGRPRPLFLLGLVGLKIGRASCRERV